MYKRQGYAFRGGYERAERKMLFFLPDWQEEADESESMTVLRCTYRKEDTDRKSTRLNSSH